jgi:hypothetical protein
MERRDFVGAMLALFTWTVMPEREIEMIHLFSTPPDTLLISDDVMKAMMSQYMNAQLYAPRGQVTVTHIGEPAQLEYAQWWREQQVPHQFQV